MAVVARGRITICVVEDGKTSYTHIRYSNDGGKTFTSNNGSAEGIYVGIYVDFVKEDSVDVKKYTWRRFQGGAYQWLDEWNNNKTEIGGESVISPRMFSGSKNSQGNLTGVGFGRDVVEVLENGVKVKKTGVFGLKNDVVTFGLDAETGGVYGCDAVFENTLIKGSLRSPFVDARDFPSNTTKVMGDNVSLECYDTKDDGGVVYSISDEDSDIGRRITLVNYLSPMYKDDGSSTGLFQESNGYVMLYMIRRLQSLFFFENGIKNPVIYIGRESVELLGYGVGGVFKGWIVVSRTGMPSADKKVRIRPTVLDFKEVYYDKYSTQNTNFIRRWSDGVIEQCMVSPQLRAGGEASINLLYPLYDTSLILISPLDGDGPFSVVEKTKTYIKIRNNGGSYTAPYVYVVGSVSHLELH